MALPKKLYVIEEEDGDGGTYFVAVEKYEGIIPNLDSNEWTTVGTYELKTKKDITIGIVDQK